VERWQNLLPLMALVKTHEGPAAVGHNVEAIDFISGFCIMRPHGRVFQGGGDKIEGEGS